eukprot:CAMPEP_0170457988 /NCGR_PEP_ID=MMETSP0123-20130129/5093_1 /TAXON_ID=182087 /ORGANISM="Favella ehrenbergii, Strain Fehren 1" /LENGTH=42 /DNA_ID= /DNA_START= /DNA_END= /DNA_ORIENTATION=
MVAAAEVEAARETEECPEFSPTNVAQGVNSRANAAVSFGQRA